MGEQREREDGSRFTGQNRPWMNLRPGETESERAGRLMRTCYACGAYIVDGAALDAHEETHRG